MEDERNTPQDQDQDEVEAHRLARDPKDVRFDGETEAVRPHNEQDDDDEVEAHARRESHIAGPEARRE